jgi:hypothetical protein
MKAAHEQAGHGWHAAAHPERIVNVGIFGTVNGTTYMLQ